MILLAAICTFLWSCGQQTTTVAETTEPAKPGLTLTAADDVMVILYAGYTNDDTVIAPDEITTDGDLRHYYYPNAQGSYHYTASGTDYYSIRKNIYLVSGSCSTMEVTPEKRAGTGWEANEIRLFSDNYIANFPSDPSLWPDYQEAFQTPQFTTESAPHQHTTQQEMEDFIDKLDSKNMYVYSMGTSTYGHNLPLVVFTKTDLSQANSLEEAAQLLNENGKITIHYQGQMHGTEPAGGEAVLAMMLKLCGDYGDQVLDTVNIYCIPRVNPDGAQDDLRNSPATDIDINRDYLLARNVEAQYLLTVGNLFKPSVMIDSHEYTAEIDRDTESWKDLLISPGFNATSGQDFVDMGMDITQNAFETVADQGFTYNYYTSIVNSKTATVGRNYYSMTGTLFFLIESRGIHFGLEQYERRVVGHLITATSIIDYVVANADKVSSVVKSEKQRIIESGLSYEEGDVLILESSNTKHPELNVPIIRYDTATGKGTESYIETEVVDQIDRSRTAPTAYVIPAGEGWVTNVLKLMDLHGISYTFAPAGSSIMLQGYTGSTTEAVLTAEQRIYFKDGAYIFTMAQEKAKVMGMLFEPDVTDLAGAKSTMVMAGIIPQYGDTYPIYRYIRDLNPDGTIKGLKTTNAN